MNPRDQVALEELDLLLNVAEEGEEARHFESQRNNGSPVKRREPKENSHKILKRPKISIKSTNQSKSTPTIIIIVELVSSFLQLDGSPSHTWEGGV